MQVTMRSAKKFAASIQDRNPWFAMIKKISSCRTKDYDGGRGLNFVLERYLEDKGPRHQIECKGSNVQLTTSIIGSTGKNDPNPNLIHRFTIPDKEERYAIRLSDAVRSLYVAGREETWVVHLIDDTSDHIAILTKAFL